MEGLLAPMEAGTMVATSRHLHLIASAVMAHHTSTMGHRESVPLVEEQHKEADGPRPRSEERCGERVYGFVKTQGARPLHGVLYVKHGEAKTFVVDAGMNDLVRPTVYDAHHDIRPVREPAAGAPRIIADVVGPVCESGDFLALDRSLVAPQPGDLLAVMSAGAYGAV